MSIVPWGVRAPVAPIVNDQAFAASASSAAGTSLGTMALANSGECNPAPVYSISGTALAINSSTGEITIGNEAAWLSAEGTDLTLTVTVQNSAGSDTATLTASSLGETLLTVLSQTNRTGSTKTSEIVEIGLPMPAGRLYSHVAIYDDDGAAGRSSPVSVFQVDQQSVDLNNDLRMARITAIIPSIAGSATRKLRAYNSPSAEPSGTQISVSDVLATAAAANGLVKVSFDIEGTTYAIDATDILTNGSTTYSKTGLWISASTFRSGPCCTEWVLRAAPRNMGTAHASGDGLHVEMHLAAYKAAAAAVGVSNPIIAFRCDVILKNEDLVRASPQNYLYGLRIERATSIADGTLIYSDDTNPLTNETIRYDYPRSAPAVDLTLSSASVGARTATRASGAWPADCIGAVIKDASGAGFITARTSDLVAAVYVYDNFGGTTLSSGTWTLEGVGHPYNCVDVVRAWIGQKPSTVTVWGDVSSAIAPSTKAPLDYVASAKMLLNHQVAYADITHSMTNLNAMRSDGATRPFAFRGTTGSLCGDMLTQIGASGGRDDIGYLPAWAVYGLGKQNDDGRRKILENARYFRWWNYIVPDRLSGSPSAGALPRPPRADNGVNYKFNGAMTGTLINVPSLVVPPWDSDNAHVPACFYPAYLLTGDLYWLQCQQAMETFTAWVSRDSAYGGSGVNKTTYGDALGSGDFGLAQNRAMQWGCRDTAQAAIITPDAAADTLYNSKEYYEARIAKTWDALRANGPDGPPGANVVWFYSNQRDGQGTYDVYVEAPWQLGFAGMALGHSRELGLTDADFVLGAAWYDKWIVDAYTDPDVISDVLLDGYEFLLKDNDAIAAIPTTWAEIFQNTVLNGPRATAELVGFARTPSGTVTFSAASVGTGRTVTFDNDYFDASYHVGGVIAEPSSGGIAKITAIAAPSSVTVTITVAFSGTTPAASGLRIPIVSPGEYAGEYASVGGDYPQAYAAAARLAVDRGTTGAAAALADMIGRSGYSEVNKWWHIGERA